MACEVLLPTNNIDQVPHSIHLASLFHSHKLLLIATLYSAVIYSYQLIAQRGYGPGGE